MAYFDQFFKSFSIDDKGSMFLALTDGTLLARRPFVESQIGSSLAKGDIFQKHLPNAPAGNAMINSAIRTGSGALFKEGTGLLVLNGANNYSGGTFVSNGTLQGNATSLQGNIVNNAKVNFDQAGVGTYAGAMSGTGSMTKLNAGTMIMTGANSYTGGTTVSAGTLQGSARSVQGNLVNQAAVVFDQAAAGTYVGNMSGAGSLTKMGNGLLVMSGGTRESGGGIEARCRL